MSTRSRIIAAQAVLVGVLIAVVFVTLLRPENRQSLLRIDAPGGQAPTAGPSPDSYEEGEDGADDDGGQEDGDPAGGGQGEPPVASPTVPGTGLPPIPPPAAGDEGSPADDQYADSLTKITERLY